MDAKDRLFELIDEQYRDQKDFAPVISQYTEKAVSDKTISGWRTGRVKSWQKILPELADALFTTVEYISKGTGSKYKKVSPPAGGIKDQIAQALHADDDDLIAAELNIDQETGEGSISFYHNGRVFPARIKSSRIADMLVESDIEKPKLPIAAEVRTLRSPDIMKLTPDEVVLVQSFRNAPISMKSKIMSELGAKRAISIPNKK